MYDIAIIGGGPAGLTAAIYAVRANKKVVVLESTACGGQIINTSHIDNYPAAPHITGLEFGQTLEKQAEDLGAEIVFGQVSQINRNNNSFDIQTDDGNFKASAVIIATGTSPRKLELADEDRLIGHGISYCATCDGNFFKNRIVAVYGGGNSALHEALYLAGLANKVYLIHRRTEFRGAESLVDKIKATANIELVLGDTVAELQSDQNLRAIKLASGKEIVLDGLFVSIGREPAVKGLIKDLLLDEAGHVVSDEKCHTNIDGVFVAGDVRTKDLRQLVTATADGAMAATEAIGYLSAKN